MRRGDYAGAGQLLTQKSAVSAANSAATTPRSAAPSGSQRSLSTGAHSTILINLDVLIHRANIGRDISPDDDDLIVLFRRNSKEVTSDPAHWSAEHSAVWNQHVDIQTSLLRQKKPQGSAPSAEFLKKEYEIVLVALPSHSAVALFSVDFATLVQLHASPQDRRKFFRVSPLKCRDLAATLEFEITWDLVSPSDGSPAAPTTTTTTLHSAAATGGTGLPPSSTLLPMKSGNTPKAQTPRSRDRNRSRRVPNETPSVPTRRTTASLSSAGSENDGSEEAAAAALNCSNCRSAKRRLDRKEVQVLQLESFLKESQKRIDALCAENEELIVREKAETRNAAQQRALNLRLLQELETAVLLCNDQIQVQDTTLLPQVELIERVKRFHEEVDPLRGHESLPSSEASHESQSPFDFRAETEAALQRNQRLQEQLEFLGRSMDYDSEGVDGGTRPHRVATDASGTTISSVRSGSVTVDCTERPVALTMTQQLNNLERENFKLRAELEGALANVASALKKHSGGYPSGFTSGPSLQAEISETTSSSSREDIEETENDDAALLTRIREQHEVEAGRIVALESELSKAKEDVDELKQQLESAQNGRSLKTDQEQPVQAPGFLDKIYADVGKAKLALEDRVKQLDEMLASATEENGRLRNQIEELEEQKSGYDDQMTSTETKISMMELERLLEVRDKELQTSEVELAALKTQLKDAADRARGSESANTELESELAGVRLSLKMARESVVQLENQLAVMSCSTATATMSTSFISRNSATSDAAGHDQLADVQKQLKLSKQEVMQLRFRSNQLESVHERLEETLKEKRTLEVKLTALEGQLFEQRSRTINSDNNSFIAPSLDTKASVMLADMQRELDQKSAELMIAEQEVEHLRSRFDERSGEGGSPSNIDDVAHQVKCFESEIACLCQRNDEQARRLKRLGNRVTVAIRERDELEAIVQQMVAEMSLLGKDVKLSGDTGIKNHSASICENDGTEKSPSPMSRLASPSNPVQVGKITDRYANAVASSSSHPSSSTTPTVSSKVAQLMKNFSS
uniref:C2 NT-type domain-containing protein n=1 Tax=Hyaloperonospora arabidopsidis (strain Emoy2) TaxID=559515 RepID=M4BLF4_HYAAE